MGDTWLKHFMHCVLFPRVLQFIIFYPNLSNIRIDFCYYINLLLITNLLLGGVRYYIFNGWSDEMGEMR